MAARIKDNQFKGIVFLILFILLTLQVLITNAQSFEKSPYTYKGFVTSFGTRSVTVSSDIQKINTTNLMATGGQVGLLFGNRTFRSKIGLFGYYSSTGNTPGTTDLYESNGVVNFYPLSLLSKRSFLIEPYFTGGLAYDRYKFFGYYLNQEPGVTNYSQGEAQYLGKIKQINATVGLGLELKLTDHFNFIHLFSEIKFGHNLSSKSDPAFSGTTLKDQTHISLGLSFGAHR